MMDKHRKGYNDIKCKWNALRNMHKIPILKLTGIENLYIYLNLQLIYNAYISM